MAVLTLAVSIGTGTAIFTVIRSIVLRPLPVIAEREAARGVRRTW